MTNPNGAKWIRPQKRAAIYRRDGGACVYCGAHRPLSLDHIKPRSKGGTNCATNLVTACVRCNVERRDTPLATFAGAIEARKIRQLARRKLRAEVAR